MVTGTVAVTGMNNVYYAGEPLIVFGPEHAATVAAGGYTKARVKRYILEHATIPRSKFSAAIFERRIRAGFPARFADAGPDEPVPVAQRADDVMVVVIGGAGKHSMFIPTFGATRSITRALKLRDGTLARSVEDFRRA